jgi:UDP-2,4-diacetamido-2,4,6-trideoxy-beta-L-altropyranose hydrolase
MNRVLFRVDSGAQMGAGHVMRCLTLANELADRGTQCEFASRQHRGNLSERIERSGFRVHMLPERGSSDNWLGATQKDDARDVLEILSRAKADCMIVDHYGVDQIWEGEIRKHVSCMVAIDDLANRQHQVDMLIDQTLGRAEEDYRKLVPPNCKLILGANFAMIRPEFHKARSLSLKRRLPGSLQKICLMFGGGDQSSLTLNVLNTCLRADLKPDTEITAIVPQSSECFPEISRFVELHGARFRVLPFVEDMAGLLSNQDLVIGAAGSAAWERCCMGVPSILFVLADNQSLVAERLAQSGAVKIVSNQDDLLGELNSFIVDPIKLEMLSSKASRVTDGLGVSRVCEAVLRLQGG